MLKMRFFSLMAGILLSISAWGDATQEIPYYGEEFYKSLQAGAEGQKLTQLLQEILSRPHVRQKTGLDKISDSCQGSQGCYQHRSIGYDHAREFILSGFYLIQEGSRYAVKDVYCEKEYTTPGPDKLPDNSVVNVEHTWPQSKFTKHFSTEMQKSDLHHLFPTDSEMNSTRGNFPFGEVNQDKKVLKCQNSRIGTTPRGKQLSFEPPEAHKGNVARALFYFSVRYKMQIDADQEAYLKKWHHEDPIDQEETARNLEIFKIQGNRNPFIDHPELVGKISDF